MNSDGPPTPPEGPPDDTEARVHLTGLIERAAANSQTVPSGVVRDALTAMVQSATAELADAAPVTGWQPIRPLVLYAAGATPNRLAAMHAAIEAVIARTALRRRAGQWMWLRADSSHSGARTWRAGLFELVMKSQLLVVSDDVAFDVPLPNGRDIDIVATVLGRPMSFEATIISESDEDHGVAAAALGAAVERGDGSFIYVRPGPFDPARAKGPSPYYDANRVYIKVFDKLARNGDAAMTQLADDTPNVILLSVWAERGLSARASIGLGWALDELFADQPNRSVMRPAAGEDNDEANLVAFLHRTFPTTATDLYAAPRRIGAIAIFDRQHLDHTRRNYNANEANALTHAELAEIERILGSPIAFDPNPVDEPAAPTTSSKTQVRSDDRAET